MFGNGLSELGFHFRRTAPFHFRLTVALVGKARRLGHLFVFNGTLTPYVWVWGSRELGKVGVCIANFNEAGRFWSELIAS